MEYNHYLRHLKKQKEKHFIATMNLGFMLKQTQDQITEHESNMKQLKVEMATVQKQLKTIKEEHEEDEQWLLQRKEYLASQMLKIKEEISQLVHLMDRQNDGLKVKLSRLGKDEFLKKPTGDKCFVDYIVDIAINNPLLLKKKMKIEKDIEQNNSYPVVPIMDIL